MKNNIKKVIILVLMVPLILIISACENNENAFFSSDFVEYDIIVEIVDVETGEGLDGVILEVEDKDGETIVAEEKTKKGVYEFSQVKLEKESDFNVYIIKDGYKSESIKLLAEGDEITRVDENAVSLDQLDLGVPETFGFNIEGDSDTGTLTFNINNIADEEGNFFTGDLIGEKSSLKIDYKKSKIKFYWYCSNSGYLHKATLFFDDIGFSDKNFDKWKEKEFTTSRKFSDTVYEKDEMAYIKKEWYDFINMIHSFDRYEIVLHLEYDEKNIEIISERLTYPIEDFEEFPVESASRAIVGTVTDENGEPVEGAEVVIWTETENLGLWRSPYLMTDENGNYGGSEYRKAAEGVYSITVEKNGYKKIEKDIDLGVPADNIKDGDAQPAPEPKVINFELEPVE